MLHTYIECVTLFCYVLPSFLFPKERKNNAKRTAMNKKNATNKKNKIEEVRLKRKTIMKFFF